ncbi:MAG TPA: phytanoyl-CoA dioxygenase family protein [Fimbriimonadaceae bacterium]|nr:phytanoyl-CoA dioxygenase family protein [Fimbriimonadaceae bacterium]
MVDYPLTRAQIRFYRENGYVQLTNMLAPEELSQIREALKSVNRMKLSDAQHVSRANPEYEKLFVQKVNLWTVHEGIRQYVFNKKIANVARRLVGARKIRLWHDHALIKMPGDSRESPWHQDLPYWPMNEPGALSCWMALDDVDERNGCMQFVPKSHSWGTFPPVDLMQGADLFEQARAAHPGQDLDMRPVTMAMPAGSCTFHDGRTFHYASANRSSKPRRAMVTIYMPQGVTYNGAGHVVTDGQGLKPGRPIAGDRFPVLA